MKFWKITFALLLSAFLCFSCNSAESTISDLKDLVEEVDELPDEYTEEDLQKLVDEYEAISAKIEKNEFTDEQMEEIGELQGKYVAKMTKASMKVAEKSFKDFGKQLESGMKGFMEELEKE